MAASRSGLRARNILSLATTIETPINGIPRGSRPFSNSLVLSSSAEARQRYGMVSPTAERSRLGRQISAAEFAMILPGTFIPPFFTSFPHHPRVLFPFIWEYIKSSFKDRLQIMLGALSSKPSLFKGPQLKLNSSSVPATAKALHRSMSEAFALGDTKTLEKVCVNKMSSMLASSIDARPKGRRYTWEVVRYNKRWRYPRVISQRMAKLDNASSAPLVRQAVVRICSRQRRVELDGKGQVVAGSEKEANLVENIAMVALVNPVTWKQSEWRIVGTFKETTPESWESEKAMIKVVEDDRVKAYADSR
ncbi:hypothetical protein B0H66DRAFT_87160 [Apodospora peruviana]|uniref:Large ribosomal subunit protein mL45 n=1 Tax=Apodospora peruviana TaxID=516989 RepID=A0AAE0ITQ3_9PEZI|nr:hypothetical protein B0H66DRAFT_87160 [Apodospora peruviana]